MIITYLGGECVKVQFGDTVLAFNPPSKESKLKTSRFGADVVLVTINYPDCNGADTAVYGDRRPFAVQGPGAYEVRGVVIKGFPTESRYGGEPRVNTVYTVALEGIKLCFLGALSSPELPGELKEELDEIDVLFVPIGGDGVLSPGAANKLAVMLSPKLVIPIHFAGLGESNALKLFLKEAGEEKTQTQEKVTLKKKDLEGKEAEVVVLDAQR